MPLTHSDLYDLCLAHPGAAATVPFGPGTLVFKVMNKMFALMPEDPPFDHPLHISLKCNPYIAQGLRETWPAVTAAYHMNKRHWIQVEMDGSVPDELVREWIAESYALVVKGLTRAEKESLKEAGEAR